MERREDQYRIEKSIHTFEEISERIFDIKNAGYCLWVGSGVTQYLCGQFTSSTSLSWSGLVNEMEGRAKFKNEGSLSFPERLSGIKKLLGHARFQQELRSFFLIPAIEALVVLDEVRKVNFPEFCRIIIPLMKLGSFANPIVNFNIESFTSILLAFPYSYHIFAYKALEDIKQMSRRERRWINFYDGPPFQRRVYHPHGALDLSGTSVLTSTEYDLLKRENKLSSRLAIQSSFQLPLLIIGMSLDDIYLREQITQFRDEIEEIYWLVDSLPIEEIRAWAEQSRVTIVTVKSWGDFWMQLHTIPDLPKQTVRTISEGWKNVMNAVYVIQNEREEILKLIDNPASEEEFRESLRRLAVDVGIIL